jgi:hypothetical protein
MIRSGGVKLNTIAGGKVNEIREILAREISHYFFRGSQASRLT